MDGQPERFIALEGAFNLRDLGGYATADGHTLRWRRLFRADGPDRLTPADRRIVAGLGIRTVLDLRSGDEAASSTWPVDDDALFLHLPVIDALPNRAALPPLHSAEELGRRYLFRLETGLASITRAVQTLAVRATMPALFHCSAGKDRTGILAAVVLSLLGVDEATIIEDYARSAEPMVRRIAVWEAAPLPHEPPLHTISEVARGAPPEAMAVFLGAVAAKYGSLVELVQRGGVGDGAITRLRKALLAD